MERKIKYFWVDTFKYNVEEDKHLSNLKDKSFILVINFHIRINCNKTGLK